MMIEETTPKVNASSLSSYASLADTKKSSSSGNFSLKSVVATAKTTSEVQRREQEKINEEEQGIMRLANKCVEQRERRGSYLQNQFERESAVRPVKKTPHEWRPPEPGENNKRVIFGRLHTWNQTRRGWYDEEKNIPPKWRYPKPDENFKRIIDGRPHTWNKKIRRWIDDTEHRERRGSRKRPRSPAKNRDSPIRKERSGDEFAMHSRSMGAKKRVSLTERNSEKAYDSRDVVDEEKRNRREIGERSTSRSFRTENECHVGLDSRDDKKELIDKVSDLQSKLDNLNEENAMWKNRYDLLMTEYEEEMTMKHEAQKSSNNSLHSLHSKIAKLEADLKKEEMEKNILTESNAKLMTDLASRVLVVDGQKKCLERLEHKNEELEGKIEDLESDNQVYSKRWESAMLELKTLKGHSKAKEDAHQKSLQETLEEHKRQLDKARLSTQTPPKSNQAETLRMKEEIESKAKENMNLQLNFNTMAMQNVRQSNTIEEQRQTIHRLRAQLDASKGNPLKIED